MLTSTILVFFSLFSFDIPSVMNWLQSAPVAKVRSSVPARTQRPKRIEKVIPLALPAIALTKNSAEDIVIKVQAFYNHTQSFGATFSQTVRNATFSKLKPRRSSGKVYILKPGKMRWDYKNAKRRSAKDPKMSRSFISDGKNLWAVMHQSKQYLKQSLSGSALPVAVSFLMGKGDLLQEFRVALDTTKKYGKQGDLVLRLTPKTPSARYKKLWLVVDAKQFSVKQSIVLNAKGDINSIVFSKVKLNSGTLKPGHFVFNAKAHAEYRLITPPKE